VVRYDEQDATISYLPGKANLATILKRYDDTPFTVSQSSPVTSIVRAEGLTLKGWTERLKVETPALPKKGADKGADKKVAATPSPPSIRLIVELTSEKSRKITTPGLSLKDASAAGVALEGDFADAPAGPDTGPLTSRQVVLLHETVQRRAGETLVPLAFKTETTDADNKQPRTIEGTLEVVLQTPRKKPAPTTLASRTGVALVGGTLEVTLGHLCDQRGCVAHLHAALGEVPGLAGVRPHPDPKTPRAILYLRADQPVDLWGLRSRLRDQGIELTGIRSRGGSGDRLRVELPSWKAEQGSEEAEQCLVCRDRTAELLETLKWADSVQVVGGGINIAADPKADGPLELATLLNLLARDGTAPLHAWLLPRGVAMPKASAPLVTRPAGKPVVGGSSSHPLIEFEFAHTSSIGTDVQSLLSGHKWASRTSVDLDKTTIARLGIADRKYANIKPLLNEFRNSGRIPQQVRLRGFGDIRIQIEFAHVCGDVVYSKPPKPKKKKKKKAGKKKAGKDAKEDVKKDLKKDAKPSKKSAAKKPFVPKPLRPAADSNGRKAIEAAVARVSWVKSGAFRDYHTKPTFNGPRKLWLAFEANGDDVVRLDELLSELRKAGFPPKSVVVSRRFSGLPFGKPMPGNLELKDTSGKPVRLETLKQKDRPLAIAFLNLTSGRKKDYKADPKYFTALAKTIETYGDRVDFVAVTGNKKDSFEELVKFWKKTDARKVRLFDDAEGRLRAALNVQSAPAPHLFVFDAQGKLRYAGDAHDEWEKEKPETDFLGQALELVFQGKYLTNGAVFYNKSLCNCSHPKCKCPKCGCGSSCRCGVGNCGVGF
jgi:hypothetical protein